VDEGADSDGGTTRYATRIDGKRDFVNVPRYSPSGAVEPVNRRDGPPSYRNSLSRSSWRIHASARRAQARSETPFEGHRHARRVLRDGVTYARRASRASFPVRPGDPRRPPGWRVARACRFEGGVRPGKEDSRRHRVPGRGPCPREVYLGSSSGRRRRRAGSARCAIPKDNGRSPRAAADTRDAVTEERRPARRRRRDVSRRQRSAGNSSSAGNPAPKARTERGSLQVSDRASARPRSESPREDPAAAAGRRPGRAPSGRPGRHDATNVPEPTRRARYPSATSCS
jgi:hypothetical protein